MHRKIFKKQLIHNDLMKMREKWLNASIYLNPQFLTNGRFAFGTDLKFTKVFTKIDDKNMQRYAKIC